MSLFLFLEKNTNNNNNNNATDRPDLFTVEENK